MADERLFGRIWTVPNLLSVTRLALLPVYVSWMSDKRFCAGAWFFGALCFTDFIDGWIARRFNQGSELGKILEPEAIILNDGLSNGTHVENYARRSLPGTSTGRERNPSKIKSPRYNGGLFVC